MLLLSDVTIPLDASKDYVRCAVLIHTLAIIALMQSTAPFSVSCFVSLALLGSLRRIISSKTPYPGYQKLGYHGSYWYLFDVSGQKKKYTRAEVRFDGSLFMVLTLLGDTHKKTLVVFRDQITRSHYSVLKLISRIGSASQ